jgi:hypothetical protein
MPLPALLLLLSACTPADGDASADTAADATVDVRFPIPDPPPGGLQWVLPDAVIPASSDTTRCYVDTYDGDDIGVNSIATYQAEGYGHHLLFWTGDVDPEIYPDGAVFDCGDPATMNGWLPLFIVHADHAENGATIATADLPDGMAIALDAGTRLVIQTHYLNTSPSPILARDAVNFEILPEDDVVTWAAPWGHGITDMPLPPGEATTHTFSCTWPQDVHLLYVFGHMHEHGTAFSLDHISSGGTERLYDVPEWDPLYRDTPPLLTWDLPGYPVATGDTFVTSCSWFNDTDAALDYPHEMCAAAGIAYPTRIPLYCNPSPAE